MSIRYRVRVKIEEIDDAKTPVAVMHEVDAVVDGYCFTVCARDLEGNPKSKEGNLYSLDLSIEGTDSYEGPKASGTP